MRLKSTAAIAIILSLIFPTTLFAAKPKAGAKCSKAGLTQIYASKKFTCIKSGKMLIWDKGGSLPKPSTSVSPSPIPSEKPASIQIKSGDQCTSAERGTTQITNSGALICKHDGISAYRWFETDASKPSNTPESSPTSSPSPTSTNIDWEKSFSTDDGYLTPFNSWRDYEVSIPEQWRQLQSAYQIASGGSGIFHLGKYVLGSARPTTKLISNEISSEVCKISDPSNARNNRGFSNNYDSGRKSYVEARKLPGPKMNILVLPIYAEDTALPKNSPKEDYGRYLDFVTEWAEYSSGGSSSINVKFPNEYIKFNGKVSDYKIFHENNQDNSEHQRFNRDLISQVDSKVDFTGIDLVYIVAPAGTALSNLQQGVLGEMNTAEGRVKAGIVQYSYTLENINSVKFNNFLVPYWWIHESYHGTFGLDDHYGDASRNVRGMGGWSLMSGWGGDMTAWEKWVLGFLTDSQVTCLAKDSQAVHWLAPSSVKTSEKKMTVIKISPFKAVVIESIRAAGLYYKIPKNSQGVLVYELDLEKVEHGDGLTVALPTNRNPNQGPFPYGEATLRLGESIISYGQRITVIDSGTYGDVVKIEKA